MEDWQPCSRILSHILDYAGYCGWIINDRKKVHSEQANHVLTATGAEILISGSKGEGLTNSLLSDTDVLFFNDNICRIIETDSVVTANEIAEPGRYIFKVERDWSPAGYCILILASRPTQPLRSDKVEQSLSVIDKGVICLKGDTFLRYLKELSNAEDLSANPLAGPSQPATAFGCLDHDFVPTISCPCSAELNAWYKRPRHHDWPSKSLQEEVVSTPANVVYVGSKDGIFHQNEWRFCFNRSELKLMHSLNTNQSNVYVVLKMILKDYLKPENKEITSYVMKNIVLWMCETNSSSSFTPSTLLSWIYVALQKLKYHIEINHLPYYMIPARNLLEGKFLDDSIKTAFLEKLSKLLESGACLVHVCETIKMGLDLYNEGMLEDYGWKRNMVEIYNFGDIGVPSDVKEKQELLCLAELENRHVHVLMPDLEALEEQGYTYQEIAKEQRYRQGLFLNPEKAEIVSQTVDDEFVSKDLRDVLGTGNTCAHQ